jgi:formylglycine-generating enzyme required for sulfatase activity
MNSKTTGWSSGWRDHGSFLALVFSLVCCVAAQAQRTATATATVVNGFVVAITVTDGGAGYPVPPKVSITGGGGSGAVASASVADGVVTQITINSAGVGYTSVPAVVISDPPPPEAPVLEGVRLQSALTIRGWVGTTNWILYADVLTPGAWTVLTNVVVSSSPYVFVDPEASAVRRFYQVAAGATPPTVPTSTPDLTRYAYIPPGTFTMGSPASEQDRSSDEGPQTVVTLTRGFWMGKYEVTQGEYVAMMGSNPSSFTGNLNRPVEQVTWYEATNYCARLTAQERSAGRLQAGWAYRLPTEAEWEYAARAGTTTRFSYGDDPGYTQLGNYAWYGANSGSQPHPVGQKQPNRWGLYDMSGNVWEWCSDWFGTYPGGSVSDPTGPGSGSFRVLRGGSCYNGGQLCRSAFRGSGTPGYRDNGIGFRAVLAAGQP